MNLVWIKITRNNDKIKFLESDDDGEEQMNMETFLKRKDLKGHWDATGVQNKKFILVLSSSQLIIMQPASDNKWAKIKARR